MSTLSWTLETTNIGNFGCCIYCPSLGLYVAGRNNSGTNTICTSPDTITWTTRTNPSTNGVIDLAFDGTTIVAIIGATIGNRYIITSTDAINWTLQGVLTALTPRSIAYGNSRFVAIGSTGGVPKTVYSLDSGVTWTASGAIPDSKATLLRSICYDSTLGLFVMVSEYTSPPDADINIFTSPDGITWTGRMGFEVAVKLGWKSVATDGLGNLVAVAVKETGVETQLVMTSSGGVIWTVRNSPINTDPGSGGWRAVCYAGSNTGFVALSDTPMGIDGYESMRSVDLGLTWTSEPTADDTNNNWRDICYSVAQNQLLGVNGSSGTQQAMGAPQIASNLELIGSGGGKVTGSAVSGPAGVDFGFGFSYVSEGGLKINSGATGEEFVNLVLIGSGGIKINSGSLEVLSVDVSGIYTLVKDKTSDTLYDRLNGSVVTEDFKIPDPFVKTGFIGS